MTILITARLAFNAGAATVVLWRYWCESLKGHVIAVDQMGADWLPFRPLKGHRSSVGTMHLEAIWTKGGEEQGELFDLFGGAA